MKILIATSDLQYAKIWRQALVDFPLYEGEVKDYKTLVLLLKKVAFEVLILDKALLEEEGINGIDALCDIQPTLRIVVMTKDPHSQEEIAAILFGAKAYCAFDLPSPTLAKVVTTILKDELWVDRKFVSRLLLEIEDIAQSRQTEAKVLDKGIGKLTPRESKVALLVATGANNRKIANQLGITERTVKAHLSAIFRKIGITDRLQLALYMNRHHHLSSIWHLPYSN